MNTYNRNYEKRINLILFFRLLIFIIKCIIVIALGFIYLTFKLINDLANM